MRHPAAGLGLRVHVVALAARQDVTTGDVEAMNMCETFLHGCVHSLIMPETHVMLLSAPAAAHAEAA